MIHWQLEDPDDSHPPLVGDELTVVVTDVAPLEDGDVGVICRVVDRG